MNSSKLQDAARDADDAREEALFRAERKSRYRDYYALKRLGHVAMARRLFPEISVMDTEVR